MFNGTKLAPRKPNNNQAKSAKKHFTEPKFREFIEDIERKGTFHFQQGFKNSFFSIFPTCTKDNIKLCEILLRKIARKLDRYKGSVPKIAKNDVYYVFGPSTGNQFLTIFYTPEEKRPHHYFINEAALYSTKEMSRIWKHSNVVKR
jgi:hypothetical protein